MASTASPKRMVSSVFITLAPPYRATVTPQQSALQAHSKATRDPQRTAARVSPGDDVHFTKPQRGDHLKTESHQGPDSRARPGTGSSAKALRPQSAQPPEVGPNRATPQQRNQGTESVPPPPPVVAAVAALPSSPRTPPFGQSTFQPPPSGQTSQSHYLTPDKQSGQRREEKATSPSIGHNEDTQSIAKQKNIQDTNNQDVCGFCRKPVPLSEPVIEALNRTYHGSCFQCRSCHIALAGQEYYNKAGIPLCGACYQASLELCWSCGDAITDHIIRALERAYHPLCFTCTTCKQQIGEQPFAQGEVGEVYCLEDYYRKYAPKCNACNELIIPKEDGTDSYNVECLGRSYHEYCYRCQVCGIQLSPEPNERGCYPLDGKILCKSCHLSLISSEGHNY